MRVVKFDKDIGESFWWVDGEDFPFEPRMEKVTVTAFGYNKYHDQFYYEGVNIIGTATGQIYFNDYKENCFDTESEAKEVYEKRLKSYREKHNG